MQHSEKCQTASVVSTIPALAYFFLYNFRENINVVHSVKSALRGPV